MNLRRTAAISGLVAAFAVAGLAPVSFAAPAVSTQASVDKLLVVTDKNIEKFWDMSNNKLTFLVVADTKDYGQYEAVVKATQGKYTVGLSGTYSKEVVAQFNVTQTPMTYAIKDWKIVDSYYGLNSKSDFQGFIDSAVFKYGK